MGKEQKTISSKDYQLAQTRRDFETILTLISGGELALVAFIELTPRLVTLKCCPPLPLSFEFKAHVVGFACALGAKLIDRKTIRDYELSTGQRGIR